MRRQNTSVLQVEGSRIQRSTVEDQKSGISSFFIFNLINFEFVGFQGRWIMTLQSMYNNATIIFFMSFTSLVESPSTCCDCLKAVEKLAVEKQLLKNWLSDKKAVEKLAVEKLAIEILAVDELQSDLDYIVVFVRSKSNL